MANEHYAEFIDEAFIKPIRSVLIVDDDYPTLDEILEGALAKAAEGEEGGGGQPLSDKRWRNDPERIRKVIAGFRRPERPLLVDIHDGANVDTKGDQKVAAHLHQSDLLVLDYELDKSKPNDGLRSIEILRGLLSNDHFNLVVVHTSERLEVVFPTILFGVLAPSCAELEEHETQLLAQLIQAREDIDPEVSVKLSQTVGEEQYLAFRKNRPGAEQSMLEGKQPFSAFRALGTQAGWSDDHQKLILRQSLAAIEEAKRGDMSKRDFGDIRWSNGARKWIKADSVFIAFSSKTEEDVIAELKAALEDWDPAPSRLFLAKLRAEMDEHGVVAQSKALERKHALAQWYSQLLNAKGEQRRWLISDSVARHSDQLLAAIVDEVEDYATRLVDAEAQAAKGKVDARCKDHFGVDLADKQTKELAKAEHNAFVGSKPRAGWHLTTGQVFEMKGEHWICLSPACDLVPGQGAKRREGLGSYLPFLAVKLHKKEIGKKLDVNTNLFVFLHVDDKLQVFSFNQEGNEKTQPIWRLFYAANGGVFGGDFGFRIAVPEIGKRRLLSVSQPAKVVAQLRYEYAINLVQKLGGALTRIGLDFQ